MGFHSFVNPLLDWNGTCSCFWERCSPLTQGKFVDKVRKL
jgi:hypothetical protein